MTINGWAQIALFVALLLLFTRPLGGYLDNVMAGRRTFLSPVLVPVERGFYRLAGINPAEEQSWWVYARAMIVFHIVGFAFLYLLLRLRDLLPLQSARHGVGAARSCRQYDGELPRQHQLAELRWREHHELSLANGRALGAELPECGDRHCARRGLRSAVLHVLKRRQSAISGPTS